MGFRWAWLVFSLGVVGTRVDAAGVGDRGDPGTTGAARFNHSVGADALPQSGADTLPAGADSTGGAPFLSVEGSFELQFDKVFDTSDPEASYGSLYATIEPEVTVNVTDQFRLFAHLVFEPVLDPPTNTTSYFADQGLYFEELYAQGTVGNLDLSAGLIDPVFGLASDDAPGLYGGDFASNYDYLGAAGVAGTWALASSEAGDGSLTAEQSVSFSVFTADRTALSKSLFTNRGQTVLSDGGVGNTQSPESFALAYTYATLDSGGEVAGPTVRFAVRHLAAGEGDQYSELGLVASAETSLDLGGERALKPIAELAYFVDYQGTADNAVDATLGAEFDQGPWSASLVGAVNDVQGAPTPIDYMVTGSVGRTFDFAATGEFDLSAGYSYAREDGETGNTAGLLLSKDFDWSR